MTRWAATATAVSMVFVAAAGCDPPRRPAPAFQAAPCPQDVRAELIAPVTCGYLSVPESRTRPGRTIRLLVTRIRPPTDTGAEPVFRAGADLAGLQNYAGTAPMAQRVGREIIMLDARGTGHSEPNLDCPEVAALTDRTLAAPTDDAPTRAAFLDAVAACHRRLSAAGIDLASYNLTEMAADAEALRVALGIPSWDVTTSGTASRIALEMMRDAPKGIRAVMLDSPEHPGSDPRALAVDATRDALQAVLRACARDVDCAAAYPHVESFLASALSRLDEHPMTLTVHANGRALAVHVDAAMLLLLLRHMLSDGGSTGSFFTPPAVPAFLADVLAGRLADRATTIAGAFGADQPYCVGYQPKCLPQHRRTLGAAYTVLCHDIAPHADQGAPSRSAGGSPGFSAAYGRSPYLDVCSRWPVGAAPATVAQPVRSDIPTFIAVGAFSPYAPAAGVQAALTGLTHQTFIVDPASGHNVVPRTPCTENIRTAWLNNPTRAPDLACLDTEHIRWELQ